MSISKPPRPEEPWKSLRDFAGDDNALLEILSALVQQYANLKPEYIGAYELERIVEKLGYNKKDKWKDLIDFLCFRTKLLDLNFRLIDDEDNHYEVSYEKLQSVIAGEFIDIGGNKYSSKAILNNTFPYFVPTEKFRQLLKLERLGDA